MKANRQVALRFHDRPAWLDAPGGRRRAFHARRVLVEEIRPSSVLIPYLLVGLDNLLLGNVGAGAHQSGRSGQILLVILSRAVLFSLSALRQIVAHYFGECRLGYVGNAVYGARGDGSSRGWDSAKVGDANAAVVTGAANANVDKAPVAVTRFDRQFIADIRYRVGTKAGLFAYELRHPNRRNGPSRLANTCFGFGDFGFVLRFAHEIIGYAKDR